MTEPQMIEAIIKIQILHSKFGYPMGKNFSFHVNDILVDLKGTKGSTKGQR